MKTIFLFLLLSVSLFPNKNDAQDQSNKVHKNFFIENKGQWPHEVIYLARVGGMNAWITSSGVVYDYYQQQPLGFSSTSKVPTEPLKNIPDKNDKLERDKTIIQGNVIKMSLVDANQSSVQKGNNKQEGYYNYFIGNDKSRWASFVPLYGDITINEIYKDINVKYYFDGNSIRYDYIIKPGADISKLRLKFEGQESLKTNDLGELIIKTSLGEVTNGRLYSYQNINGKKKEIESHFSQSTDGTIRLIASEYDKEKELVIDPLVYSTFLGGSHEDYANSIAVDALGNAFITGATYSTDFPVTPGAYQTTNNAQRDVFVTKLNSTGSNLIYSTYLGGSNGYHAAINEGRSIAVDPSGNAFITGYTQTSDFPVTPGAYQTSYYDSYDVFVTKINPSGSSLIYSTYLGAIYSEYGNAIAIDDSGNAYIAGETYSVHFPTTQGSFQTTIGSDYDEDAFVTKINPSGSGLVYSTFLGGSGVDYANSIAVDKSGNVFITGATNSANFPVTTGSFQTSLSGGYDVFITRINSSGSSLIYSTYLGGASPDWGNSIAIDASGNAFITGTTQSDFPVTQGAYQTNHHGFYDAFVTKIDPMGSSLVYSTLLGGSFYDRGFSLVVDALGSAFVTGYTNSIDFPTTPGSFQTSLSGGYDVFITRINPSGNNIIYSTYLGASYDENGYSIATDNLGTAFITGQAQSADFPVTPGAYQTTNHGGVGMFDAFVTKIEMQITGTHEINSMPKNYSLCQNYPNPFNPTTEIDYSLSKAGKVKLTVYNVVGSKVTTLINEYKSAGNYSVNFNASDLPSGIYFYKLEAGEFSQVKKMIILK